MLVSEDITPLLYPKSSGISGVQHQDDILVTTCCSSPASTGLLQPLAPCSGMTELLTTWEVTIIGDVGRFLTASESLLPVDSLAFLGWLVLPVPHGGMPEVLAAH
jgi:hypothetical protein